MTDVLDLLLRPRRVALVGVSRDPGHLTARPARYLSEWAPDLDVVIIHPEAGGGRLHGHPAVSSVAAAGGIDVALLLVPADRLEAVVGECAAAGTGAAISVASGFAGQEGADRRGCLRQITADSGMRLLGPNCVGLVSPATGTVLSFSSVLLRDRPAPGHVGLVTQSGAIGNALMLALSRRGVGLAHWLSTGDELDIGAIEIATGLAHDPACRAVGLFIEGITDPEWLPSLASAIAETRTRVVALRTAGSAAGRRAAFGHTGRVVGNDEIARAALRAAGVELVDSLHELTDILTVLSALPSARSERDHVRVGVVTVSGGTGVLAADKIDEAASLAMADFTSEADRITGDVDVPVVVANPLDVAVLGRPEVFPQAIEAVTRLDAVDAVVAIVSTLAHDYELLADAPYLRETPLVMTHLSPEERFTTAQAARLAVRGIPSVPSVSAAVRALAIWAGNQPRDGAATQDDPPISGGPVLPLSEAVVALGLEDLAPVMRVIPEVDDAFAFLRDHGSLALKAEGLTISHRSDVGAVAVGLQDEQDVLAAWNRVAAVCSRHGDRVVAQAMAAPGTEVMVTAVHDAELGPAVVLRPGGVHTELMSGTVILTGDPGTWSPDRLDDGPLGKMLSGWRGGAPGDVPALLDLAERLRKAVQEGGAIECNPVIVRPAGHGLSVVDVLVPSKGRGA